MNICTLIPAYKTDYIESLLLAIRTQTVLPYRIIFSDDSPNGAFTDRLLSPEFALLRAGLNIEVLNGPRNGAFENFKHLVSAWNGESELFHLLLDDDVIYPEFYERHLVAHMSGNFSCSISRRWEANVSGQPTRGVNVPTAVARDASRMIALGPEVAFMTTVAEGKNWLGEFSNTVLRRSCQHLVLEPRLAGVSYAGLWDLGAFLAASVEQPICFIQDYLGFFRKGPGQNSAQSFSPIMKAAVLGYVALAVAGRRLGTMDDDQAQKTFAIISGALNYWYPTQKDLDELKTAVARLAAGGNDAEADFLESWESFLSTHGY